MRLGVPHVSAAQFPPQIRVGPLFVPGVTGCLHCQEAAARRGFPEYDALVRYREAHRRPAATVGPLSGLVGSLLATDAMHLITGVATPGDAGPRPGDRHARAVGRRRGGRARAGLRRVRAAPLILCRPPAARR